METEVEFCQHSEPQFLQHVGSLPIVQMALGELASIYRHTKDSSRYIKYTLEAAEAGIQIVTQATVPAVVNRLERPIGAINTAACSQLDTLEEKFPLITKPMDVVVGETKKVYDATLKPTIDRVTGVTLTSINMVGAAKQYTVDTVNSIKDYTTNTVSGVKDYTYNTVVATASYGKGKLDAALQTQTGQTVKSRVDQVLEKTWKPTVDTVTSLTKTSMNTVGAAKQYTVDTVNSIKDRTYNTVTATAFYGKSKLDSALETQTGQTVISKVDQLLDRTEQYVDYYLPEEKKEGEEMSKESKDDETDEKAVGPAGDNKPTDVTFGKLVNMSNVVRRRIYAKSMRNMDNIQRRSRETLQHLSFTGKPGSSNPQGEEVTAGGDSKPVEEVDTEPATVKEPSPEVKAPSPEAEKTETFSPVVEEENHEEQSSEAEKGSSSLQTEEVTAGRDSGTVDDIDTEPSIVQEAYLELEAPSSEKTEEGLCSPQGEEVTANGESETVEEMNTEPSTVKAPSPEVKAPYSEAEKTETFSPVVEKQKYEDKSSKTDKESCRPQGKECVTHGGKETVQPMDTWAAMVKLPSSKVDKTETPSPVVEKQNHEDQTRKTDEESSHPQGDEVTANGVSETVEEMDSEPATVKAPSPEVKAPSSEAEKTETTYPAGGKKKHKYQTSKTDEKSSSPQEEEVTADGDKKMVHKMDTCPSTVKAPPTKIMSPSSLAGWMRKKSQKSKHNPSTKTSK